MFGFARCLVRYGLLALLCLLFAGCQNSMVSKGQTVGKPTGSAGGESQETIDFFYAINGRDITLTPVVSVKGIDKSKLKYIWNTADKFGINEECPTVTVPEPATATTVSLYVFNGEPSAENRLAKVDKTISLTGTLSSVGAGTTGGSVDLFQFAEGKTHPDKNPDYMYFALQIEGSSIHGTFRTGATKNGQPTDAYPRSVQYEHALSPDDRFTSMYAQATPHLASLNVGYTNETGFGNQDGTAFSLPFYFGDNKCRVKINGKLNLSYTFANFVLWDTTVDTFFGNWGWPVLIRLGASDPLRITIPMDSYEPSKHKNIARLRVKFNDHEKPQHFRYEVIFEDFVAR